MRFRLTPRSMLFAVLCICLTSEELWLKNALAFDTGRIVFTSLRDGNPEIYVMDADGNNREKLEDQARYPSWSPDGKQIALVSFDGFAEIYVIGVGGRGRRRVTNDLEAKLNPSFSPDGRRIAYDAHPKGFGHIYVVGADGRNRVRLTHNEEHHGRPAWSPDGRIIAYDVVHGIGPGNRHSTIHLMASNGRYIRQLSDGGNAIDFDPDISPLGLAVSPASRTSTTWGKLKKVEFNRP